MFDWIPWLWSFMDWGPTWLVGCVVSACIGLLVLGAAYEILEDDTCADELIPALIFGVFVFAGISVFWPVVVIGLPFIVGAVGLFMGGRHVVKTLEEKK